MTPDTMTVEEYRKLKKPSREKNHIESVFKKLGLKVIPEYAFVPGRRFKSDWFIPSKNILIEYEGLIFANNKKGSTGKSGHTTVTGYTSNCDKYNFAAKLGYHLLRYTALNFKNIEQDLKELICILQR